MANEQRRKVRTSEPGSTRSWQRRTGIYELRAKQGHVQYRLLYFFHSRQVAILAHSLTKEDAVPDVDIERAIKRKKLFEANPKVHTYESEI